VYVKSACRIRSLVLPCKKSTNALCDGESPQADFRYVFGTCQLRKVPFMYSKTSLRGLKKYHSAEALSEGMSPLLNAAWSLRSLAKVRHVMQVNPQPVHCSGIHMCLRTIKEASCNAVSSPSFHLPLRRRFHHCVTVIRHRSNCCHAVRNNSPLLRFVYELDTQTAD
jgi:hypothetical protein